jgi:hypothetical protein
MNGVIAGSGLAPIPEETIEAIIRRDAIEILGIG